jgi:hypothetical protein
MQIDASESINKLVLFKLMNQVKFIKNKLASEANEEEDDDDFSNHFSD